MIGTVLLFDGYSESIALTIEVAVAFAVLTYLNVSERAIYLSLATFSIPLVSALSVLYSPLWNEGIWHRDSLATLCTALALIGSTLWLTEQERFRFKSWFSVVSGTLGVTSLVYTLLFLAQVGQVYGAGSYVFIYVLWGGFIAVCTYYSLMSTLPLSWLHSCCAAFILPVSVSITSLDPSVWEAGVVHRDAFGLYIMVAITTELLILSVLRYRATEQVVYKNWVIGFLVGVIAYAFAILAVFWPGLLGQGAVGVDVVLYVSYAVITYALVTVFWHLRAPIPAVYYGLSVGIIPVLMSLVSIDSPLWNESVLQPAAAGLYTMTALVFLLAIKWSVANTMQSTTVKNVATGLYVLGGTYATMLVWLMAHTLSTTADIAVTVALFVYTVAGLGLYVFGSSRIDKTIKYAGMTLLVLVVLRLGLVEVWNMDMIWRIVTFLGIGLLFMLAALLEKKPNR